ncbi:63_t:CDS:2, partial [Dentiscutata erythropus]
FSILKYSLFASESKSTTSVDNKPPKEVLFEANICEAVNININSVLNELTDCDFSSQKSYIGQPDFTFYHNNDLTVVVEVKRKHILKNIGKRTLSEFYPINDSNSSNIWLY